MNENRQKALDCILVSEDGTLNTGKTEPGGASKWGVSVVYLSDYNKKFGRPPATVADVAALSRDDAVKVYSTMMLDEILFDSLPDGVDYRLADMVVTQGTTGGITLLQLALQMWPITGIMDSLTLSLTKAQDQRDLIGRMSAAWIATKHRDPNWNPSDVTKSGYGHGWSNRNVAATSQALGMVR